MGENGEYGALVLQDEGGSIRILLNPKSVDMEGVTTLAQAQAANEQLKQGIEERNRQAIAAWEARTGLKYDPEWRERAKAQEAPAEPSAQPAAEPVTQPELSSVEQPSAGPKFKLVREPVGEHGAYMEGTKENGHWVGEVRLFNTGKDKLPAMIEHYDSSGRLEIRETMHSTDRSKVYIRTTFYADGSSIQTMYAPSGETVLKTSIGANGHEEIVYSRAQERLRRRIEEAKDNKYFPKESIDWELLMSDKDGMQLADDLLFYIEDRKRQDEELPSLDKKQNENARKRAQAKLREAKKKALAKQEELQKRRGQAGNMALSVSADGKRYFRDADEVLEDFIKELEGVELNEEQRGIYDVVTRKKKETDIRKRDLRSIIKFRKGSRGKGGKKIITTHYAGLRNPVTAREVIDMGIVIRHGTLVEDGTDAHPTSYHYEYISPVDGAKLTLVVDRGKKGDEEVINYYSNRKVRNRGQEASSGSMTSSSENTIANPGADVKPGNTALSVGGFGLNANARAEMEKVRKQYEGTDKWMKAPNGRPTKLAERQWLQVRTPSFKAWFGDWENDPEHASKVVDGNGEPLVVYHGTDADPKFYQFSHKFTMRNGAALGRGFYFSEDKSVAEGYGNDVIPVFLNIKKPLEPAKNKITKEDLKRLIRHIDPNGDTIADYARSDRGYPGKEWYERSLDEAVDVIFSDSQISDSEILGEMFSVWGGEAALRGVVEVLGYDGFVPKNTLSDDVKIAFLPEQIKSATENVGTFDPENPDIRLSIGSRMGRWDDKPQPGLITIPPQNTALSVGDLHTGARMAYGKPDSKFIGSGEGAQVYGWGHYSSGVKGVARDEYAMRYVEDLQEYSKVQYKGDPKSAVSIGGVVYDNVVDFAYEASRIEEAIHNKLQNYERIEKDEEGNFVVGDKTVPKELLTFIAATRTALVDAQTVFSAWTGKAVPKDYRDPEFYRIARDRAKSEQDSVLPMSRFYGEMMLRGPLKSKKAWAAFVDSFFPKMERLKPEGQLPAVMTQTWWTHRPEGDESHLLNWFEPIEGDNREIVIRAIEGIASDYNWDDEVLDGEFGEDWRDREDLTGGEVYEGVANLIYKNTADFKEARQLASEGLYAYDIDGVKYPVDSYFNDDNRDGNKGWNYVAFSDEHLRVDSVEEWNPETDRFEPRPVPGNTALSLGDGFKRRLDGVNEALFGKLEPLTRGEDAHLYREGFGDVRYPFSDSDKRGRKDATGFVHIVSQRLRRDVDDLDDAVAIAVLVADAVENGEKKSGRSSNTTYFDKDGVRAVVGTHEDGEKVVTGFQIWESEEEKANANFRSATRASVPHGSSEEMVASLARIIANRLGNGSANTAFSVGERPGRAPVVEPGGDVREAGEGALAWLRRKFVHSQTPVFDAVRRVMGVGREPPDALNVEAAAKNVHGKIRARQEMLQRAYLEPLKAILAQPGMDRKRFDDYALALHALERNRMIQERSVVVDPTSGEVVDLGVEAGSGVTNAWAERVIREIQRDPFAEQYKEAANILAEMNRFVLRGAVADGLLTEAQARTWMRLSPHYVPLKSGGAAAGASIVGWRGFVGERAQVEVGLVFGLVGLQPPQQALVQAVQAEDLLVQRVQQAVLLGDDGFQIDDAALEGFVRFHGVPFAQRKMAPGSSSVEGAWQGLGSGAGSGSATRNGAQGSPAGSPQRASTQRLTCTQAERVRRPSPSAKAERMSVRPSRMRRSAPGPGR